MDVSAPLPENFMLRLPSREELLKEIIRTSSELRWALHKQRATWAHMAHTPAEYRERGNLYFYENDRHWKLATGDVSWWRGEVSSRANALSALLQLAASMHIDVS